ncbi:MAG: S-layer homology domain-containing protein [Clostridia bacterium]|nr:S-layer homology domain-containing protein [Clostridia bacterium]
MKKIIAMLLVVTMCLAVVLTGIISAAEEKMPFTDVKEGKWFYPSVKAVWEKGVMEGKSETQFAPNEQMTRAQLVTILYRLAGAETEGLAESLTFKDTKKSAWYAEYVGWAVKEGLVNGYEDNTFRPNDPVLRQELAKLFSTFLDYAGYEFIGTVLIESFSDSAKHPEWAKEYIEDLRAIGLVGGDNSGAFNPKSTATRAEVATIITRLLPAVFPEDTGDTDVTEPDTTAPDTTEPDVTEPVESFEGVKFYVNDAWKDLPAPADDPTPENIGKIYEDESGLSISEVMLIDDCLSDTPSDVMASGIGIHGGHEIKLVRTRYGTFVVFVTADVSEEGRSYDEFALLKITSDGTRLIFKDEFHHSQGSCVPNILQGKNGELFITLFNDTWSTGSGRLTMYRFDAKTEKYTKDVVTIPFDVPSNQCHGYGYTQPVIDLEMGKIYAIFNGGDIPGYIAWFIYDIESGKWEPSCYTVEIDWRCCYLNAYPDGRGGMYFVEERAMLITELGKQLGVDFATQTGYVWDALYLFHIPDVHKEEMDITVVYEPTYDTEAERVKQESAAHYGCGSSIVDSEGNLQLLYTVKRNNRSYLYHAVYDKYMKEVKNTQIKLTNDKNSYTPMLAEGLDGSIYILAVDTYMTKKQADLEIWKSTDSGMTFKKICEPVTLKVRGAEEGSDTILPTKLIATSVRNNSDNDGTVGLIMFNQSDNGKYDYYYLSVTLPHE